MSVARRLAGNNRTEYMLDESDTFEARKALSTESSAAASVILNSLKGFQKTFVWPLDDEVNAIGKQVYDLRKQGKEPSGSPKVNTLLARQTGAPPHKMIMAVVPKLLTLVKSCHRLANPSQGLTEDINDLRGVVERFAALEVVKDKSLAIVPSGKVKSFEELVQVADVIADLLGTRFDWEAHQFTSFEEMGKKTEYTDPKRDEPDLWGRGFQARNILGQIDKVDKKLPGIRAYYNFCSEFVHPNFGDLISTTCDKTLVPTMFNKVAVATTYCENSLNEDSGWSQYTKSRFLLAEAYRFGTKVIEQVPPQVAFYKDVLGSAIRVNRRNAHKKIRNSKDQFSKNDFCPCGSGKRISICLKTN
ncbi:hypothetical protein [Ruegeria profundi]|uniref:SEC-C domain-containing protein n=1 Tax=Ruegeria profundi TaxID=1685378 RepID=A0A0X3TPX9_9RHOB|nr:hypothetical protein [Ruegeria profundi]KUJ77763.1 hypothetical protein AVO44_15645 [Ruegeria profundi]